MELAYDAMLEIFTREGKLEGLTTRYKLPVTKGNAWHVYLKELS